MTVRMDLDGFVQQNAHVGFQPSEIEPILVRKYQ